MKTFLNQFWGTSSTVGEKDKKRSLCSFLKINGSLLSKKQQLNVQFHGCICSRKVIFTQKQLFFPPFFGHLSNTEKKARRASFKKGDREKSLFIAISEEQYICEESKIDKGKKIGTQIIAQFRGKTIIFIDHKL